MPCKCHRNDYSHIDACKRSLLMLRVFLLLLLWCSVQSGGQRHFLVHHLERLCQCDHTREGKYISRNRHLSNALSSLNWMSVGCDADGAVCTQGLVTTLHEGEDFGQLALLNDAPRAATIILREDNCHFLRVDKQDFIRILKVSLTGPLLSVRCINAAGPIPKPFVSSFRMLRRTQCDLRSTGRLCWCWRRAPTGPSREERETTASEKLRQHSPLHKQVHNH